MEAITVSRTQGVCFKRLLVLHVHSKWYQKTAALATVTTEELITCIVMNEDLGHSANKRNQAAKVLG